MTVAENKKLLKFTSHTSEITLRLLRLINKLDECLTDKPLDKNNLLNKI